MDFLHMLAFVVGVLLITKCEEEGVVIGVILNAWAWGVF